MTIVKSKPMVRTKLMAVNSTGTKRVIQEHVRAESYKPIVWLPMPTKLGVTEKYFVEVEYMGEKEYKRPYAKRLAAQQSAAAASAKIKAELAAKGIVSCRQRIMNQVELAFEKKGKTAMQFITCSHSDCNDLAVTLTLAHLHPGSTMIDPEQITGATCKRHTWHKPQGTTAQIPCDKLEFFYDGLRQIYINSI
jgi:hypothetical protein